MSVDLPAPFSPMSAWISPGNSRKSTPSRATTPGKIFLMPVIFNCSAMWAPFSGGPPVSGRPTGRDSVLTGRQSFLGLLRGEGRLLGEHALRDGLAGLGLLDQVHQLWAEQRAALHDEVDLVFG